MLSSVAFTEYSKILNSPLLRCGSKIFTNSVLHASNTGTNDCNAAIPNAGFNNFLWIFQESTVNMVHVIANKITKNGF